MTEPRAATQPLGRTPREVRAAITARLQHLSAHPESEAERWICRATGWNRARLYSHLDDSVPIDLDAGEWQRRCDGVPLAYVWGAEEFFGLTLQVTPDVLIPRPDTELLVERVLDRLTQLDATPAPRVVDLGTGSGAIALAVKHGMPAAQVTATDRSPAALAVASQNAERLQLDIHTRLADWFQGLPQDSGWDLVLSNPPYIDPRDPHLADLRHEPDSALTADAHGLADLQHIIRGAPARLRPGGALIVEHGYDQGAAVRALFLEAGFTDVITTRDYGGNERVTEGTRA